MRDSLSNTTQYAYDAAGNRTQMADGVGTTTWAYDELSRPITITDPFTGTVGYTYNGSFA
jgi:YD repeat-containing protein